MNTMNYRIKSNYVLIAHSENLIEFRSGIWNPTSFTLSDEEEKGKLYLVAKHLNGHHSSREISKISGVKTSEIEEVIDQLLQLGILELGEDDPVETFLSNYMPAFGQERDAGKNQPVLVIGDEELSYAISKQLQSCIPQDSVKILSKKDPLFGKLENLKEENWLYDGISYFEKEAEFNEFKDYFVVLAFSVINPSLARNFNQLAQLLKLRWLHVAIDGPFLFIGPSFVGGEFPCYNCLEQRVLMNLRESASYQKYKQAIVEKKIVRSEGRINPLLLNLVASHASIEVVNNLATGGSFTHRKVLGIYLPTMEIAFNEVMGLSTCSICGPTMHKTDQQLYFDMQTQLQGQ